LGSGIEEVVEGLVLLLQGRRVSGVTHGRRRGKVRQGFRRYGARVSQEIEVRWARSGVWHLALGE
jgi:hypothetical protein